MSNVVNKIKKGNTTYDIHDARLTVSIADAGKVVGVNADGELALLHGGTRLYKHRLDFIAESSAYGDDVDEILTPIYLITTFPEEIKLEVTPDALTNERGLICGNAVYPIFTMSIDVNSDDNTKFDISCNSASLTGYFSFKDVSVFSDTVTEL